MTQTEQELLEKKDLEQLLSGKSLFGKEGAFTPMLKSFIEKALEAEMENHLSLIEPRSAKSPDFSEHEKKNRAFKGEMLCTIGFN